MSATASGACLGAISHKPIPFLLALTALAFLLLNPASPGPASAAIGQWWNGFSQQGLDGPGTTLLVHDGELLVGGGFDHAGDREITKLAAFDGQAWRSIHGAGYPGIHWPRSMVVHQGRLHVADVYSTFELGPYGWSELDCQSWWCGPYGGLNTYRLLSWQDQLHTIGYLWVFEGADQPLFATWDEQGGTVHIPSGPTRGGHIQRGLAYEGKLVLAGTFVLSLGVIQHMVRWNGSTLEDFNEGFYVPNQGGRVTDLELYGESLLAFGWLQAGPFPSGIVEYDGEQWGDFSGGRVDAVISAATVQEGMVYVAGDFTEIGGVPAAGLARWNGSAWEALADLPVTSEGATPTVWDMLFYDGQLYLAGSFDSVDGMPSQNIARWYPPLDVDAPPVARRELALEIHPNPFNPRTTIEFELAGTGDARLDILDVAGRLVRRVDLAGHGEGPGSWQWDGRDDDGAGLASGVYFVRLSESEQLARSRVTLLK